MISILSAARAGAAAMLICLPIAAQAAERLDRAHFDVYLKGFRIGVLAFEGRDNGQKYSTAGKLQSTGWIGKIAKVQYDAKSAGRISDDRFVPELYEESADTGKRQSQSVMAYRNGVPQVKKYLPPKPRRDGDVDPATQAGTVDPMTSIYVALRDIEGGEPCALKLFMFDGRRRSQISLKNPVIGGDTMECGGEYRRLQGFSAEEMAEKAVFPFELTYKKAANGTWRTTKIVTETLYGTAVLHRR